MESKNRKDSYLNQLNRFYIPMFSLPITLIQIITLIAVCFFQEHPKYTYLLNIVVLLLTSLPEHFFIYILEFIWVVFLFDNLHQDTILGVRICGWVLIFGSLIKLMESFTEAYNEVHKKVK